MVVRLVDFAREQNPKMGGVATDDLRMDSSEEGCVQSTAPPTRRIAHTYSLCWWGFTSFELGRRSALQSPARQEGMEACGSTQGGTRWRSF